MDYHLRDDRAQEAVFALVDLGVDLQERVEVRLQAPPQRRGFRVAGALDLLRHAPQCRKEVELRMETTGRKELVRWVLSWMPEVRVLAPKSLRDRIALKLEEGLRRNGEDQRMPNQTLHTNREQARGR